jgi:hypothetical protein
MPALVHQNVSQHVFGGGRMQTGVVDFNGFDTAEIPLTLTVVSACSFVELGAAGSVDMPSLDEANVESGIAVPATGTVTVKLAAVGARKFVYSFVGY